MLSKKIFTIVISIFITACGGDTSSPSQIAEVSIPNNIDIIFPASTDISNTVSFNSSASSVTNLKYNWDFGDGSISTEAAPKHTYVKAGDYDVKLVVSNSGNQSKEVKIKITINNQAGVRGLECSGASNTGWCWQAPRPTGNEISAVEFVNVNTGWHVGGMGEIYKTVDGGKNWSRQISGVSANLEDVKFFDDKYGWISGVDTLLRTSDGGASWTKLSDPTKFSKGYDRRMTVLSAHSILLESGNQVYLTVDGGQSWRSNGNDLDYTSTRTGSGIFYTINGASLRKYASVGQEPTEVLAMKDETGESVTYAFVNVSGEKYLMANGVMRGTSVDGISQVGKRRFWRSDDAGANWRMFNPVGLPLKLNPYIVRALDMEGKVWIASDDSSIYRSEDGGLSWVALTNSNNNIYSYFSDGFLMGARAITKAGKTFKFSDDFGKTWENLNLPSVTGNEFYGSITSKAGILSVDIHGKGTFISADKGDIWVQVLSKQAYPRIKSVVFLDARNGLLTNSDRVLQTSNDGGKTWQIQQSDFGGIKLQFVDVKTGYMLKEDGLLYKTSDSGKSWFKTANVTQWSYFNFFDEKNGSATSYLDPSSISQNFSITRDGGNSWTALLVPNDRIRNLFVDASNTVTVVGALGYIAQTTDGGKTWVQRSSGIVSDLRRVYSLDTKTFWAIGASANVLRSNDAGVTWVKVMVPGESFLNDIQFIDSKNGWIVGTGGLVLATQDGGATWKQQASGTNKNLNSIQFVDSKTGWIIGEDGTLLATGTGGY